MYWNAGGRRSGALPEADWTADRIADRLLRFHSEHLDDQAVTRLEFVEHIAYLLFLKIDHERSQRGGRFASKPVAPMGTWPRLTDLSGDTLHRQLHELMYLLGEARTERHPERATAKVLFRDARPWNVQRMSELSRLMVEEIDAYQWTSVPSDALGRAFSRLILDCRVDILGKKGTGQILTPLAVLTVLARALDIRPDDRVIDPAGGSGGSLIAAHRVMLGHGGRVGPEAIAAADLDPQMCRLATMNILLNTGRPFDEAPPVVQADSLKLQGVPLQRADSTVIPTVALCNPPFRNTGGGPESEQRADFWAHFDYPTDFLQHIAITLPIGARAAVFVPEGVLVNPGAATVRRNLLQTCDVHTLLRLPTGLFHGTNAKSNVLFFTKAAPKPNGEPATNELWVYDARDRHHTDTHNPVTEADFDDFLTVYRPAGDFENREPSRGFGRHSAHEILAHRDASLNLSADQAAGPQEFGSPHEIALSIADRLAEAEDRFRAVGEALR
ncbi:class I SAM-dependent DNA methyltransferase [Streptomyces sp. NPDC059863]|uniref:HsdM family class I SAM-dependent methyltransferase n=1 Tax=unclassified Streptomyces TaxID=2593676 RepID=UPI003646D8D6